MACPMRVFLFFFSLLLLLAALAYYAVGQDAAFFAPQPWRTWRAFLVALFSGELLYDAYYGAGSWRGGGILYCEPAPGEPEAAPAPGRPGAAPAPEAAHAHEQ